MDRVQTVEGYPFGWWAGWVIGMASLKAGRVAFFDHEVIVDHGVGWLALSFVLVYAESVVVV